MWFSWFDAREEKQFGQSLAAILIERLSLEGPARNNRLMGKKHDAMLHNMMQQISSFTRDRKMNTYKKAQVGNAFKWALKDKGYDPEYVDQLTNWLMLKI
jgi:hypothetical protein